MTHHYHNPWLELMWLQCQAGRQVAQKLDPELLCDPQTLSAYWLDTCEDNLNPLEFHGRRRPVKAIGANQTAY